MSYEAWHEVGPEGPTCGLCGRPLRHDRKEDHECPEDTRPRDHGGDSPSYRASMVDAGRGHLLR